MTAELNPDLVGWWRIVETSQWANDYLDDLGPAVLSITGKFSIDQGDKSTFIAERTSAPAEPIQDPPSYRDKWRRRRW